MKVLKFRISLRDLWQPTLIFGVLFAALGGLLFYKLGTLLPGYNASEVASYQASTNIRYIFDNPFNAPFTLATHALTYISNQSFLLTRLAATAFGLVTLAAFCWLLNHWYGRRTAFLGTALFGTSAWFLHTARFGGPEVLLFGLITLVAAGVWLKQTSKPLALIFTFAVAAALLYVPGMIWLLILTTLWEWRTIDRIFKNHLWMVSLGALLIVAAIAPLAWAIYRTPSLWKTYLGLPAEGWPQIMEVLHNLYQVPLAFIYNFKDANAAGWLGNLPILDIFCLAMLVLGGYLFIANSRLSRVKVVAVALLAGFLLVILGGSVGLSIMVPFLYIIVAAGVGYLIDQWYKVFPRNPIAQLVGIALVSLAILTACIYNGRQYFIAWPLNSATKAVYSIPDPATSDTILK